MRNLSRVMGTRLLWTCYTVAFVGLAMFFLHRISQVQTTEVSRDVDITQHPYMVSIERHGLHHCAGVVLGERLVLTAAHCFKQPGTYTVRAGATTVQQGGSEHELKQVIAHPRYSSSQLAFDIAIGEVSPPFALSNSITAAKLADFGDPEPAGNIGEIIAWGHTKNPTEESQALRRVHALVLRHEACEELDPENATASPHVICVSYIKGNVERDPYVSEAGAPLVLRGALVGVASWRLLVAPGTAPGPYGLFCGVQALRAWIDNGSQIVVGAAVRDGLQ